MSDQEPKAESTQSRISSSHADDAMNSSPTPGPWHIQNKGDIYSPSARCEIVSSDDKTIARVKGLTAEAEANARLIAAAPDLLAAAESYIIVLKHLNTEQTREALMQMEALVRKAKGG